MLPTFQDPMLPLMKLMQDKQPHKMSDIIPALSKHFDLTPADMAQRLPSGQLTFYNRVSWAGTFLKKAGLLVSAGRGVLQITPLGSKILASSPTVIDVKFLEQFDSFLAFQGKSQTLTGPVTPKDDPIQKTPDEILESAFKDICAELAQQILDSIKGCSPAFFERLVVELLVTMGYGGSYEDAARAVGKTSDGGIDGIIAEDRLGLDSIYIQAKRWESVVGRPEIQKFVGALAGMTAKKGVFLTTSSFTKEAKDYVRHLDPKVVLIDGDRLSQLMIDYDLGVSTTATYKIKRIDSDYFADV